MNPAARTALVIILCAAPAAAQPPPPNRAPTAVAEVDPAAPGGSSCQRGAAGALAEIACELAATLETAPRPLLVSASEPTADVEVKARKELVGRLLSTIAGRIGEGAAVDGEARTLNAARAAAKRRASALLYLRPEIARGELRVVADVYPGPGRFWDRVRDPEPAASLHAYAARRLDPELRSLLPPVPLVATRIDKASSPERQPVALACDDVDGDGGLELVVVGRHHVHVGRIRAGRLVAQASTPWKELSPVAQSPLQEPVASVAVSAGSHIDVGSSDRAFALRLGPDLKERQHIGRRLPWPGGGCSRFYGLVVEHKLERCFEGDGLPSLNDVGWAADAIASARMLDRQGRARLVRAARIANSAEVVLRDDARREAHVQNLGAQLALGDLDGDGQPELLAGANVLDANRDSLAVFTWRDDGSVVERHRIPVPAGIRAIAACPAENSGLAAVAIAVPDGLWVVR